MLPLPLQNKTAHCTSTFTHKPNLRPTCEGKSYSNADSIDYRDTSPSPRSAEKQIKESPQCAMQHHLDQEESECLWKEAPAPPPLRGRPSLGLIPNGKVRTLSKKLLMSCPDEGNEEGVLTHDYEKSKNSNEVRLRQRVRRAEVGEHR